MLIKLSYDEQGKERCDKYLSAHLNESRAHIKKLIDSGNLKVNGETVKSSRILREGDLIEFNHFKKEILKETVPQDIHIDIVYEDNHLAVINKVSGMTVHPAAGNFKDTLANALAYKYKDLPGDNFRPGIAHRLDKETSGAIIIAKEEKTLKALNEMFKNRSVKKEYSALVFGNINEEKITIDAPIARSRKFRKKMTVAEAGKDAFSEIYVSGVFNEFSFIRVFPRTGRTHQIRAHLKYINHPIVGDSLYSEGLSGKCAKKYGVDLRLMLHSLSVEFTHPATSQKLKITAPYNADFKNILNKLSRAV